LAIGVVSFAWLVSVVSQHRKRK